MHTAFIEHVDVSVLELLGAVLTVSIADWDMLLTMVAAVTLAVCAYEFFKSNVRHARRDRRARNAMQAQTMQIDLQSVANCLDSPLCRSPTWSGVLFLETGKMLARIEPPLVPAQQCRSDQQRQPVVDHPEHQ